VLLFGVPGLVRSLRASAPPAERLVTVAGILVFVLYGFVATWWGGWLFGPRHMTDMLPFFALWLARTPLPARGASRWRRSSSPRSPGRSPSSSSACAPTPAAWEAWPVNVDRAPGRLWSLRDTELSRCWTALRERSAPLPQ
jgi:hypothetical protein